MNKKQLEILRPIIKEIISEAKKPTDFSGAKINLVFYANDSTLGKGWFIATDKGSFQIDSKLNFKPLLGNYKKGEL